MKAHLCTLALFFLTSSAFSQQFIGNADDIEQIVKNTEHFSTYVMTDNYDMIGKSYTADAKIFPNNTEIIEGTEAIVAYWKHPENISITHHKITQSEIKIMGEEAYDYGYYEGTTRKADGSTVDWKGKYVIIWRKEAGLWKMYLDMWNTVR